MRSADEGSKAFKNLKASCVFSSWTVCSRPLIFDRRRFSLGERRRFPGFFNLFMNAANISLGPANQFALIRLIHSRTPVNPNPASFAFSNSSVYRLALIQGLFFHRPRCPGAPPLERGAGPNSRPDWRESVGWKILLPLPAPRSSGLGGVVRPGR
jgi:hypothetical protein